MICASCGHSNGEHAVLCNLCSKPLGESAPPEPLSTPPQPDPPTSWKDRLKHPLTALAIGLACFPIAKLLYLPNYVFNFLTTLVHEIGHSLAAWLMGMPSFPTVSVAGGGFTPWREQMILVCFFIMAALGFCLYQFRERKRLRIVLGVALALYPILAFLGPANLIATAGGIFLEIAGAGVCFTVVLAMPLRRPFERPLYALWGFWMLLNRAWESILMLKSPAYFDEQAIIQSGLAAGITSDLGRLRTELNVSDQVILLVILFLCLAAPAGAFLAAWWVRRSRPSA